MNRICQLFVVLALVFWSMGGAEAQERSGRVALVVGNAAYTGATPLANPTNDARDVAKLLAALDFEVIEAIDVDRRSFSGALDKFIDRASRAEAALLYYAGHGIQLDEDNYLLPIDTGAESVFALKADAFSLRSILGELEAVSPVNLVFLDACRNNPLAEKLSRAIATRSGAPLGRGLARVVPTSGNTMVAFAAAPGAVALDGTGRNSPFTTAFLKNVGSSKEEVSTLFKGIVRDVLATTQGKQQPQLFSSMSVNFFFSDPVTITVAPPPPDNAAQTALDFATTVNTIGAFEVVVARYPGTVQAQLAAAAVEKLVAAEKQREADRLAAAAASQPEPPRVEVASLSPEEIENSLGLAPELRRDVQAALTRLGYDAGGSDGVFGDRTRNAIRQYQIATAAPETGYISLDLLASLGIPFGAPPPKQVKARSSLAESYQVASLEEDVDPRLRKALATLEPYQLNFGYFDGHLYLAVLTWGMGWYEAKALAEEAGGHLLTVSSKAENEFAYSLFADDDRFYDREDQTVNGPYIGLIQAEGSKEPLDGWRWVSGEPFKYKNWSPKNPDNWNGGQNVASFFAPDPNLSRKDRRPNRWDDRNEKGTRGFVMEVE